MPDRDARNPRLRTTIVLSVLQAVVAGIAWISVWLRQLEAPGCAQECNGELLLRTIDITGWTILGVVVASTIGTITLRRHRWVWSIPTGGLVIVLIGAVIAHQLCSQALAPSL